MFSNIPRCKSVVLLMLAATAMLIGGTAYAQITPEHGIGISKVCAGPIRTCDIDADCADDDLCTDNVCDTSGDERTSLRCTFTVSNNTDGFNDSLSILDAQDVLETAGGTVVLTYPADISITGTAGNATCAPGPALPCTIHPAGGGLAFGQVQFVSEGYEPTMDDYAAGGIISDQATVTYADLCNGTPDGSCNEGENDVQASAQSQLVDGCVETPTDCDDGNPCTLDSCDPLTGCEYEDVVCDDGNACTEDSCNPNTGECEFGPPTVCDDGNACTADSCDPNTGECVFGDPTVCDDGNACTDDSCDPNTGQCVYAPNYDCDDGDACTDDSCDPNTGECVNTPNYDCDDGDACTDDSCDPATGECVNTPNYDCDDGDVCTDDSCDPNTGECVNVDNGTCDAAICRTPGFWGSHGGDSKNRSQNITQAVIDDAGGLNVCGVTIDNTDVGSDTSALEAMCVSVKGVSERQLVRQLTAAALNCVMSGGDSDCVGGPIEELFADCNDSCQGFASDRSINECIGEIDCFNNGGFWAGGSCTYNPGACSISGGLCDVDNDTCDGGLGDTCEPDPQENCHEVELCQVDEAGEPIEDGLCFIPPGPAGSSGECNQARKNSTYVGNY